MKVDAVGIKSAVPQRMAGTNTKEEVQHRATKQDTVEISEGGRRQLADRADARLKESGILGTDSSTYKLEQIKQKVDAGYYDIPEVQQRIVRRLSDVVMLQVGTIQPDKKDQ